MFVKLGIRALLSIDDKIKYTIIIHNIYLCIAYNEPRKAWPMASLKHPKTTPSHRQSLPSPLIRFKRLLEQ